MGVGYEVIGEHNHGDCRQLIRDLEFINWRKEQARTTAWALRAIYDDVEDQEVVVEILTFLENCKSSLSSIYSQEHDLTKSFAKFGVSMRQVLFQSSTSWSGSLNKY